MNILKGVPDSRFLEVGLTQEKWPQGSKKIGLWTPFTQIHQVLINLEMSLWLQARKANAALLRRLL